MYARYRALWFIMEARPGLHADLSRHTAVQRSSAVLWRGSHTGFGVPWRWPAISVHFGAVHLAWSEYRPQVRWTALIFNTRVIFDPGTDGSLPLFQKSPKDKLSLKTFCHPSSSPPGPWSSHIYTFLYGHTHSFWQGSKKNRRKHFSMRTMLHQLWYCSYMIFLPPKENSICRTHFISNYRMIAYVT